jgi:hypothetical protein
MSAPKYVETLAKIIGSLAVSTANNIIYPTMIEDFHEASILLAQRKLYNDAIKAAYAACSMAGAETRVKVARNLVGIIEKTIDASQLDGQAGFSALKGLSSAAELFHNTKDSKTGQQVIALWQECFEALRQEGHPVLLQEEAERTIRNTAHASLRAAAEKALAQIITPAAALGS